VAQQIISIFRFWNITIVNGNTDARIVETLLHALKKRGMKKGMATPCGGDGVSTATTWEMI
jgi:acetyl-CoA acetyltransferase